MNNKVVHLKHKGNVDWRRIKVCAQLVNRRPAYTNNEIANLFKSKFLSEGKTFENISKEYMISSQTIQYMLTDKCHYSFEMLKFASKYLEIPYMELTQILEDDNKFSCRTDKDENSDELFNIINFMFNEMIKQERLSK
jgi:hypothetical protein